MLVDTNIEYNRPVIVKQLIDGDTVYSLFSDGTAQIDIHGQSETEYSHAKDGSTVRRSGEDFINSTSKLSPEEAARIDWSKGYNRADIPTSSIDPENFFAVC